MHIEDVIIRFTRQIYYDDHAIYQAEVRKSPVLLRGGPFRADIEAQLDQLHVLFTNRIVVEHRYWETPADLDPDAEQAAQELADLGSHLYELLPEALREGLPRLLQHVFDKKQRVRLIFEATAGDQADRLLSMPWEILYLKALRLHLGLIPQVLIVRRLLGAVRRAAPLLLPPFRIAHVIADTGDPAPIALALKAAEQRAIQQAAGQDDRYTLVTSPGSVEQLLARLRAQPYQIVHFLGHGNVDVAVSQQSYLIFAGADGAAQIVTGEQLQHLLSATPGVQIIVLNACHGASVGAVDTIAMQLVYNGIPSVVAMQGEVLQQAAAVFAHSFYTAVQHKASLEQAVATARLAIAAELPGAIDWSLPALYTSAGVTEAPVAERALSQIERWIGQPEGQRQIGSFSLGLGVVQLLVALLLLSSGAAPSLPGLAAVAPVIGLMAALPPLLTLGARLSGRILLPAVVGWTPAGQAALLLRMLSAAALGIGLPAIYAWFLLLLIAAFGFWATLAPIAQAVLLGLLFVPCALVGWQEALGHARGFLSNVGMAPPTLDWQELIVIVAGYLMLCGPLLLLWLTPGAIAPPLGNFAVGALLVAIGYQLRKQAVAPAA
jgi:CHAT domain